MALPESVMAALAEFSSARSAVRNVTMAEMAEIKSLTRPPQIVPKADEDAFEVANPPGKEQPQLTSWIDIKKRIGRPRNRFVKTVYSTLLDQLVRLPASVATAHAALSQTNPPSIISASPACNPLFKWCNAATALVKQYDELPDELKSVLLNTARASMDAEAEAHILLPELLIEATESARAAPGTRLYPKGNKAPSPEKAGPRGVAGSASAEGRRKFIVPKQPPKPWQKGLSADQYKARREEQRKAAVRAKIQANEKAAAVTAARKEAAEATRAKEARKVALQAEADDKARSALETAVAAAESTVEVLIISGVTGSNADAINGGYLVDRCALDADVAAVVDTVLEVEAEVAVEEPQLQSGSPHHSPGKGAAGGAAATPVDGTFARHNGRITFSKDSDPSTRLWAAPGPGAQWCVSPTSVMETNVKNGYCFLLRKNAAIPSASKGCKVFNAGLWEKQPTVLVEMCTAEEYADVKRLLVAKAAAMLVVDQAKEVASRNPAAAAAAAAAASTPSTSAKYGPIKGRAKRAAAAAAGGVVGPVPLVLGTMNIIGDATNPIEFMPNAADLSSLPGGAASYEAARATAAAALAKYTVADATVSAASCGVVAEHLETFVAAQGYAGTESVVALCKGKKLDLGLDNKWTDRLNPIVLGLSAMPADASTFQMMAASNDPASYLAALLAYYAAADKWPAAAAAREGEGKGEGGGAELESVAGLLLWDLLCASAVAAEPAAFATLSQPSYLMEASSSSSAVAFAVPREALLASLAKPLASVLESAAGGAVAIVGCQEMPSEVGPLEGALPAGTTVYRAPTPSGNITGFVYSSSLAPSFADVSEQLRPELLAHLEAQKVDKKVRETTVRKMVVGTFDIPGRGKVAVVVFHCKSFKKLVRSQANFVAHALARAKAVFGCEAYGVGDMNIEAKWAKGTSSEDQAAAVTAAPLGMLPGKTAANSATFGSVLAGGGYTAYPAAGTITTLKMRTQFQGQPDKEGDLTAVHKDYVLLPTRESGNVSSVVVGGRPGDGGWSSNLELLQPSRFWPADHFTIFTPFSHDGTN
eukprot:gene9601-15729_t